MSQADNYEIEVELESTDKKSYLKQAILSVVKSIPENKVMYYGQIADLVGTSPRIVGFIMNGLSKEEMELVPWQRVVAKDGYISSLKLGPKGNLHKKLLKKEGYIIDGDKVDMNEHLWLLAGINHLEHRVEEYADFIESLKR